MMRSTDVGRVLLDAIRAGIYFARGPTGYRIGGSDEARRLLGPRLREHKPELLEDPRRCAEAAFQAAVDEVAGRWNALFDADLPVPELDDERESLAIRAAIRAADLPSALAAVARWRQLWIGALEQAEEA